MHEAAAVPIDDAYAGLGYKRGLRIVGKSLWPYYKSELCFQYRFLAAAATHSNNALTDSGLIDSYNSGNRRNA